ncbi:ATP phosphoribosyltransferase regulatory subunit [Albimonas donghaensis]|uniref:ATP phosphoribosyltransferase regulatory subunit n=1 Tax=Albimonas donghaensis TaxID=356660 RepID=A0A1H2YAB0_9RHOB|nr:ATP phosphoribosyltransferase regulatory subunit [Albimonas donghaensis]SDX01991.1 ATP phosphoribosyltransferase regulatory subunit [Albimonas donghaensis]
MSADRAYLTGGRMGDGLARLAAEIARIDAGFADAGAQAVEPAALQPSGPLLGLYGEDIRARAFVTTDPVEGELMLRPDFTVPVLRLHMQGGAAPARYRYCGPVYRRQEPGSARPTEYLQAGVEILGEADPVAADAEVFALIREALGEVAETAAVRTGDLSIAFAAVAGLEAPERWKAALRRHLWRPAKFRAVLEGFGERPAPTPARAALVAAANQGEDALRAHVRALGPLHGARPFEDVLARARELAQDARMTLPRGQIDWLEAVLAVKGPSAEALEALRALDVNAALRPALDRMARRLDALGPGAETLPFDASFGRGLEYYDGFTFEFSAPDRPGLPPLAGGGRYDALTSRLGFVGALPAVGGIVRPEALLAASGGV